MSKLLLNTAKALLQYAKNKENETTRGGNNTALVSNNKGIPKLEKDIINTYENGNRNERQQTANLYNDVKNTMTENLLSALGQKDQARGRADAYTEDIRRTGGSLNPMNYNSLADYMINAPYSAQAVLSNKAEDTLNKAYDKTNDKPWYKSSPLEYALGKTAGKLGFTGNRGTLTEEMKRAGLTQEDLDRWNKAENEKDRQNLLSDWAKNHKIGATLNAIPENAFGSMSGTIKKLGDYIKGNPIEERPTNADIYRQTVSDTIDSKIGKLAYGGLNSIGDMAFASMLAAPLGAAVGGASAGSALSKLAPRAAAGVMGAEKANEVMNDAVLRGLTPDQIVAEGVGSGVTTALTEMLPFERFARGGNVLGAMASEGLQEGAEDIADTILDELVTAAGRNQDKSTLHQNYNAYKEAGFSDEDALKNVIADYAKQVGTDTVMGGITGGLMGAGGNLVQGRNPITGRLPELRNVNEEVNENADVVNESNDVINENVDNVNEKVDIPKLTREEIEAEKRRINETLSQNVYDDVQPRDIDTNLYKSTADSYNTMLREYGQSENALAIAEDINRAYNDIISANNATQQQEAIERFNYLTRTADEALENRSDDLYMNRRVYEQNTKPDTSSITDRRENRDLLNLAQQYKDKLSVFEKSDYSKETKSQIKAIDKAIKSGDMNAIREALANADNVMQGAEIGVNARQFNKDSFQAMQDATDGYKIKVNPKDLADLNLGVKNVTELDRTFGQTGSNNRLHFVAPDNAKGFYIDEVYDDIREKSGYMLPSSDGMNTTDMLNALMNYIKQPKSASDEMVNTRTWNDIGLSDSRPQAIIDAEQISDKFIDDIIADGSNEEIWTNYLDSMSELATKYPELSDQITDTLIDTYQAAKELPESTTKLDDDIKNVQTVDEAVDLLDKEISAINMTTDFFGNGLGNNPESESTRVDTGRKKVSKAYTNTGLNSDIMTEEEQAMHDSDESMLYIENSEKESMDAANKKLKENGKANEYKRLLEDGDYSNVDMDEAMILWKELNDRIRDLKEQGLDYKSELKRAHALFTQIKNQASAGGSRVQALAKWSRNNTPEGLLAEASAIINRAKVGKDGRVDWNKLVAKETKGKTDTMDIDFMDKFLTEASKLEGLDMESREAKQIMANLGKLVNTQIPISLREKITTILMDNMLGNVRTLLTRNAGGNIGFNLLEDFVRRPLSGLIDKGVGKITDKRTTTGLSRAMLKAGWEGFKDGVAQEIYDFKNDIQSARSGENTLANATSNNRSALTSKIGHFYNKLVKAGLSFGDRPFFEKTYKMTMAEYQQMYDQGMFGDMKKSDFEELAKAYAQLNALTAVYQDNSLISDAFLEMKEAVNKISEGIVGADVLSQFTMPFVKTPANIIQRSIEYSPIGIIKNAVQTIREVRGAKSAKAPGGHLEFNREAQARFVNETSRNIIGTALFAAGMALANSGAMTGAYDEDKDMRQAQKEAGMQEYALHNPFGLEADVDVSWIPVLGNNLVASAAAYDAANDPELSIAQQFGKGATAGLKSQFESSMLQGLQRFIGGSGSFGNDGGDLLSNSVDTLKSGATQFIPSILRQTAAAFDPYQRQLAGPNPDDYYINSVLSAIPGLRDNLQPKISRTGEALEQNHARTQLGQIFNNYINPANVTYGTPDAVRDEAMRLYESTGNNIAFQPSVTMSELKKDDHVPTAEEFTEYQRNAYGSMNSIASDLIDSDYYQSLNDGEKEQLLADIYSAVKTVEKKKVLGEDLDDLSGAAKAFYEDGDDGLVKYMTAKNILSEMGMQNNPTNREKVYDKIDQGGTEAAQEMVDQAKELEEAGLNTNMQFKYEHAQKAIPSLSPTQFADTWNTINTDNNSSIKIDEVIDYLNKDPKKYDDQTAQQVWNAYYSGSSNKLPVLDEKTGLWKAK